jgi:hypothetical protein
MRRRLAGRLRAIVAGYAVCRDPVVIEGGRRPSGRLVAFFTGVAGRKMRRRFASGLGAIVAGHTVDSDARMIKCRASPSLGRFMAIFAGVV